MGEFNNFIIKENYSLENAAYFGVSSQIHNILTETANNTLFAEITQLEKCYYLNTFFELKQIAAILIQFPKKKEILGSCFLNKLKIKLKNIAYFWAFSRNVFLINFKLIISIQKKIII